ncbi:MAG TPA: proline--tRNA ligase, partial [Candidatus Babeliales bacterium]|nr:proline--tRNA ligase [Candidatus Babeliales bacterium]
MGIQAHIKTDFPQWYLDVIFEAELVDYGPSRGSMVIRPYGYAMWEHMQAILDAKIKAQGIQNAYFPLLIPESFLVKEKKHVEGFSPELAIVTHAGGKLLEEPLVIRPTSETIIYYMFAKWIKSYRDLPYKVNQWANVVRWEMRPRPFLRTTEILWQEGHTAHHTQEEAREMALAMQEMYRDFMENYLAIPVITGEKTESERFAGADATYTLEAMMQDGKALQMGTAHVLAQSFSRAFDILYQGPDGEMTSPHCSSFGVTTRMIGAMVMVHGDDNGLIIPPRIAPYQVVVVPIYRDNDSKKVVMAVIDQLSTACKKAGIRIIIDDDERKRPGAKYYHWELRGIPVRLEIGPKDVREGSVAVVSRIAVDGVDKKYMVSQETLVEHISDLLIKIQNKLFLNAQKRRNEQFYSQVKTIDAIADALEKQSGFYSVSWCGNTVCE